MGKNIPITIGVTKRQWNFIQEVAQIHGIMPYEWVEKWVATALYTERDNLRAAVQLKHARFEDDAATPQAN